MPERSRTRGPIHRLMENLAGLASTRLALASIEAQEALERAMSCLAWLLFAVLALAFAWALGLGALLVLAARHDALLLACGGLAGLHLAAGALALLLMKQKLRSGGGFFEITREEFERDRAVLLERPEDAA